MTLSDPNPGFKVTVYLEVEYLKKTVGFREKLLKNTNRKPYTFYRMVQLSMTLSDLACSQRNETRSALEAFV